MATASTRTRLYPSIHPDDEEARDDLARRNRRSRRSGSWPLRGELVGSPGGRIGPNGPDSEIYMDRGPQYGKRYPGGRPGSRTTASSESGTSSSCSIPAAADGDEYAARPAEYRHRHGPGTTGDDPPGRADRLRDRPLRADFMRRRRRSPASSTAGMRRSTARCASSPTTAAASPSSSAMASCRATRGAAISCGASCGG